jgi:starch synthase
MKILAVSSEMVPYAKTGGLADVVGALPHYLAKSGHDVRVFIPLYGSIRRDSLNLVNVVERLDVRLGVHYYRIRILRDADNSLAHFVDCPALYDRGSVYTRDADEHRRFLALCWAALMACQHMRFAPDVVHCHDWHTAMLPLILKTSFAWDRLFSKTRCLLTIHNLEYQGGFPAKILPDLNLNDQQHLLHQEFLQQGRINFLLHGILYADGISTVSATYAAQMQSPEHGAGLDPFLRARQSTVVGILNGVDYEEWSPDRDQYLKHRYSAVDVSGKEDCKQELLGSLGLPYVPRVPVAGIVSRMATQKGLDLVPEALLPALSERALQLVVLGSGDPHLEYLFGELQYRFPRQVVFYRGFSNPLAHRIEAGADMFLMPSRHEPCGLNQLYSLRYGTVPVVFRTGGLADSVQLWNPRSRQGTGLVFEHHDVRGLRWAVESAMALYHDRRAWRKLMANGMAKDYSWTRQVKLYEELFSRLGAR